MTEVPPFLVGMNYVRTANDDKRADENDLNFLCFDVGSDATVYVLYDSRASTLPGWVAADFVDKHQAAAIHTDTNMAQGALASRLRFAAFNGNTLTSAAPPQVSRSTGTRWRRATSAWAATARRVRARTTLLWSARRASRRPGAKLFVCGRYCVCNRAELCGKPIPSISRQPARAILVATIASPHGAVLVCVCSTSTPLSAEML